MTSGKIYGMVTDENFQPFFIENVQNLNRKICKIRFTEKIAHG